MRILRIRAMGTIINISSIAVAVIEYLYGVIRIQYHHLSYLLPGGSLTGVLPHCAFRWRLRPIDNRSIGKQIGAFRFPGKLQREIVRRCRIRLSFVRCFVDYFGRVGGLSVHIAFAQDKPIRRDVRVSLKELENEIQTRFVATGEDVGYAGWLYTQ